MLWKKNHKVNLELRPKGAGWEYVYLTVNGERHKFVISTVLGYSFSVLLEGLYYMNPDLYDPLDSDFCPHRDIFDYVYRVEEIDGVSSYIVETMEEGEQKIGRKIGFGVSDIPYRIKFSWKDEPGSTEWLIEKPKNDEPIFDLDIHIVNYSQSAEKKVIDFKISYKEFCYIVAKAATEALKKHGILGYHQSVYYEDMQLRCLLRLKAYALGCEKEVAVRKFSDTEGDVSSLEAELRLLMKDMR